MSQMRTERRQSGGDVGAEHAFAPVINAVDSHKAASRDRGVNSAAALIRDSGKKGRFYNGDRFCNFIISRQDSRFGASNRTSMLRLAKFKREQIGLPEPLI